MSNNPLPMSNYTNLLTNLTTLPPQRCLATPAYWIACEALFQATYYVLTPLYYIFAVLGHSLCLYVCYKEAKKEGAYFYQIFCLVSELCEAFAIGFHYTLCGFFGVLGADRSGWASDRFRESYTMTWFYAFFSSPLMQALTTTSLLFAVCASLDRVLAMAKPFRYKNWNHKRLQVVTCLACVFLGFGTTAYDCFRKYVNLNLKTGQYVITLDEDYMQSPMIGFLNQLRNGVRVLGMIGLIVCNSLLMYIFHSKVMTSKNAISPSSNGQVAQSEKKRDAGREAEKTLLIITMYQSISNFVDMTFTVIYFFMLYLPDFPNCLIFLMWPLMDFICGMASGFDFYVLLLVSKKFRQLVRSHVWRKNVNIVTVGVIVSSNTNCV